MKDSKGSRLAVILVTTNEKVRLKNSEAWFGHN